ncbi:unnamed protein product, partial [Linum tenue]
MTTAITRTTLILKSSFIILTNYNSNLFTPDSSYTKIRSDLPDPQSTQITTPFLHPLLL